MLFIALSNREPVERRRYSLGGGWFKADNRRFNAPRTTTRAQKANMLALNELAYVKAPKCAIIYNVPIAKMIFLDVDDGILEYLY